ncbi:alkylphosphonate utilization protein [Desulfoluna sp.]|uniref:alkylphosphonate utilization protein n=1 Tax=Desulfoluna sp. TaxID=2045199 RepID=UPI00345902C5
MKTKDSNGTLLNDGDSVQLIKDLKVKRGKTLKKIHLTDNPENIECREGKTTMVLKTCFLKKV